MRVYLLGGFLGAGKTTAIRAAARLLGERGERVAIITNDQGDTLVDTALCEPAAESVQEIGGGCFCCRFGDLERALLVARDAGATMALAEAVGSCTDMIATVISPLAERGLEDLEVAPLSVLVDPWRAAEVEAGQLPPDVCYLFAKQVEEADVLVLTRADRDDAPEVEPFLRGIRPNVSLVRISGSSGAGVADWLAAEPVEPGQPLDIDYDRYAAAEALLGWANGRVLVTAEEGGAVDPRRLIERFFGGLSTEPVAHLKVHLDGNLRGTASLVRSGGEVTAELGALPAELPELVLRVNARVAIPPEELDAKLRIALAGALNGASHRWLELDSFAPGYPVPVHRHLRRRDPSGDAACCAAFYRSPAVQYLLGESYHPGGTELTLELAANLELAEGGRVLDVACGIGSSLRSVQTRYPVHAVGLEVSAADLPGDERLGFLSGDAHAIPAEDERFDAVLCECALSTFASQPRALAEMYRVLRPGGRVAISDMLANGPIPESLSRWVTVGTCLAHARTLEGYAALLREAGFEVVAQRDTRWALEALLRRIKRRLIGVVFAKKSGALAADVEIDVKGGRDALREGAALVAAGTVSYGYLVARRPLRRA